MARRRNNKNRHGPGQSGGNGQHNDFYKITSGQKSGKANQYGGSRNEGSSNKGKRGHSKNRPKDRKSKKRRDGKKNDKEISQHNPEAPRDEFRSNQNNFQSEYFHKYFDPENISYYPDQYNFTHPFSPEVNTNGFLAAQFQGQVNLRYYYETRFKWTRDADGDMVMVDLATSRPVWYRGPWQNPFYEETFEPRPMEGVELLDDASQSEIVRDREHGRYI
ncbi:hypothetical protein MPH_03455 [Macrophomina phaseolina MS6]|uniref:Uncharacterized protein n=1 Tax=Macrophomina phaseolina (strain MS6) TaxID=1126212 RepID=K2RAU1_MACPH|nr:hypothetical protein MPH_03455 [Macrophomina phaseolina MS6]